MILNEADGDASEFAQAQNEMDNEADAGLDVVSSDAGMDAGVGDEGGDRETIMAYADTVAYLKNKTTEEKQAWVDKILADPALSEVILARAAEMTSPAEEEALPAEEEALPAEEEVVPTSGMQQAIGDRSNAEMNPMGESVVRTVDMFDFAEGQ